MNLVDTDIQNWTIVQNVLNHKETIKLVKDLIEELEQIERELYYISKIEQRPAIINFLKLDDYKELSEWEKQHFETELEEVRARRRQTENKYNEEKSAFGEREQQVIELRKIGKTLMTDARCPLCGHEYSTTQQLINIIDNAVVVDDKMDMLIREMQDLDKKIIELEKIIDRQNLIDKAKKELLELTNVVPMVKMCGSNYKRLYEYVISGIEKEKRKEEIIEQQTALDNQGFSIRNRESNINDTKSIEELTLDDLTLDFHQFAQIRNILRRNQEKLVARDEWEVLPEETNTDTAGQRKMTIDSTEAENFYMILDSDERRILDVLVADRPDSIADFLKLVSPFPNYKTILERINEKALDFYEETIINTDEMLPYVEEDYLDELKEQNTSFYDKNRAENAGQQKR